MELKDIKSPADIKNLTVSELEHIASQMRDAVLHRTSIIGGHVGPNLGVVETTLAMHYVFDAPKDKLVYDVSHQDFPHKMITGRVDGFINEADFHKIGEYTSPVESPEYDVFYAGHTSPMISQTIGLAMARELNGQDYKIAVLIGDGSLSGGVALEGLNTAAQVKGNFVIIFNDNQMAIAPNNGGLYPHLQKLRETAGQCPDNIFRAFGLDYEYIAQGDDMATMLEAMKRAYATTRPTVIHVNTQKGEGYAPAEENREAFHWRNPFDIRTGQLKKLAPEPNAQSVVRDFLVKKCDEVSNLLVVVSATPDYFTLDPPTRAQMGRHLLDVDIAEQTGASVTSGAARGGAKVVYCVNATFLQRAYDQLMEDFAMNPGAGMIVVGLTGIAAINDQTHLGWWDIPMVTSIPNIVYLAPTNLDEYQAMLEWGLGQDKFKVAVREPLYTIERADGPVDTDYSDINTFKMVHKGSRVAIIAAGDFFVKGKEVLKLLAERGIDATLINPRFISGVDEKMLKSLEENHEVVATLEDGSVEGGFGQRVASFLGSSPLKVLNFGVAKEFHDRMPVAQLEELNHLQPQQIVADILARL